MPITFSAHSATSAPHMAPRIARIDHAMPSRRPITQPTDYHPRKSDIYSAMAQRAHLWSPARLGDSRR